MHFLKLPRLQWGGGGEEVGGRPERSVRKVFIHSFTKYLFITVYLPGTVLGAGKITGYKKDNVPNLMEL